MYPTLTLLWCACARGSGCVSESDVLFEWAEMLSWWRRVSSKLERSSKCPLPACLLASVLYPLHTHPHFCESLGQPVSGWVSNLFFWQLLLHASGPASLHLVKQIMEWSLWNLCLLRHIPSPISLCSKWTSFHSSSFRSCAALLL